MIMNMKPEAELVNEVKYVKFKYENNLIKSETVIIKIKN